METSAIIRLVSNGAITKDALFGRLMTDLFFALGYDNVSTNVPQLRSGIVYLQGQHAFESRRLRAECRIRATRKELGNFITSLSRERRKNNNEIINGYFVALGRMPDLVIEFEQEMLVNYNSTKILDGEKVIRELEKAKLLVNDELAVELAAQCLEFAGLQKLAQQQIELLTHETGYIKAVYFGEHKRSHVAFIHASGHILAEPIARTILEDDKAVGGGIHTLRYLVSPPELEGNNAVVEDVLAHYKRWLSAECGSIQLDGLPTDSDLGPRKLDLERLFVPLNIISAEQVLEDDEGFNLVDRDVSHPIGDLLTKSAHIAILASPGGGKSTLLKRLAIAYAFPERRSEIDDNLPERNWLPLFLRCRDLQADSSERIISLLKDIPVRAEMTIGQYHIFNNVVQESLQTGRILLLVDGLDEISNENSRIAFVRNLRIFLAVFPQTALIVTSREAGFRLVAGTIASMCRNVRLAPFSQDDIKTLCVSWLTEVENDSKQVREGALKLADDIWHSERIRALAENPLLLTTLLVVKRWIGELPRNRAALYGVAVQVLVRTWNVEGYEPLDEQETLAQLSYVACAMMEQGIQRISHNALLKLLQEAREELDAELQFVMVSPAQFIERVESRSSLLMQTGRVLEDGDLQPVYEFRHLTFQEYAAARGYAKEQHPHRNLETPFVDLLAPHFDDERWREVIPLAVVMAERKATEATVKKLVELCANPGDESDAHRANAPYLNLLLSCILDEVKLTVNTLTSALKVLAIYGRYNVLSDSDIEKLKNSKVGELMTSTLEQAFLSGIDNWEAYGGTLAELYYNKVISFDKPREVNDFIENILVGLSSQERRVRIRAALQLMQFCFLARRNPNPYKNKNLILTESPVKLTSKQVANLYDKTNEVLESGDWPAILATSWALGWAGVGAFYNHAPNQTSVELLIKLWKQAPTTYVATYVAWGFASSGLLDRDALVSLLSKQEVWGDFLQEQHKLKWSNNREYTMRRAIILLAWYRRSPWSDEELAEMIKETYRLADRSEFPHVLRDQEYAFSILSTLGIIGESIKKQHLRLLEGLQLERAARNKHGNDKSLKISPDEE